MLITFESSFEVLHFRTLLKRISRYAHVLTFLVDVPVIISDQPIIFASFWKGVSDCFFILELK
jgi:hypothetical protein